MMIGINVIETRGRGRRHTCINFKLSCMVNVIRARFCKSDVEIVRLDSSNSSLTAASSTVSPGSIFPPNPFHFPFPNPRNYRMRRGKWNNKVLWNRGGDTEY